MGLKVLFVVPYERCPCSCCLSIWANPLFCSCIGSCASSPSTLPSSSSPCSWSQSTTECGIYRCSICDTTEIPRAPIKKQPMRVSVAALAESPPFSRYFFAEGSMLYNEEKIMTPKDRLNPVDRKALLSSILKFFLPGNWRIMRSTHIIDAPNVHAIPLTTAMIHPRVSLSRTISVLFE